MPIFKPKKGSRFLIYQSFGTPCLFQRNLFQSRSEQLGYFFQFFTYLDMLRADLFTLSALHTLRCSLFPMSIDLPLQCIRRRGLVPIQGINIHCGERSGDPDIIRADFCTVIAGRARDQRDLVHLFSGILETCHLLFRQPVKILHIRNVILHLLYIAHTGQDHQHTFQIRCKTDCPGSNRMIWLFCLQAFSYHKQCPAGN